MKDFRNYSDEELDTVLKFTAALADAHEARNGTTNFASIPADEASLEDAAKQAKAYADRRKAGFTNRSTSDGSDDDGEIRAGIRKWLRRGNRVKK